jgi:DnaJ domain
MLGIHRQAEPEVIDAAYRALARRYHPDRNPGDRSADERTRQIIEAYSVLSDAGKRRTYNREWDARHTPRPPVTKQPPPRPKPPSPTVESKPSVPSTPTKDDGPLIPWWLKAIFLLQAVGTTYLALTSISQGYVVGYWILLWAIGSWWAVWLFVWPDFQSRRRFPGLTEGNFRRVMRWGKRTLCPPEGAGCRGTVWDYERTRGLCTWRGLCKVGYIERGYRETWEVWIEGDTGQGRLRQSGR